MEEEKNEFEKVFDSEKEEEKNLETIIDVDSGQYKYLKNIGQPSVIKINLQKAIEWYEEDGRKIRLEVVTSLEDDPDMALRRRQYGLTIGDLQKAYLYWYNGKFVSTAKNPLIVDISHSFRTLSYPHIFGFAVGHNKRDERIYDLQVGQVVRIDNIADAELILERFSYVVEVDEGGNFKPETVKYLRDLKVRPLKKSEMAGVDFPDPQKVGFEEFKPHNPDNKPIDLVKGNEEDMK